MDSNTQRLLQSQTELHSEPNAPLGGIKEPLTLSFRIIVRYWKTFKENKYSDKLQYQTFIRLKV